MQKFFDLSPSLRTDFPTHPGNHPVKVRMIAVFERDGYRSERLNITSHTGCHLDAPAHLVRKGRTVDEIPVESFVGQCVVVDLRDKKAGEPIKVKDLKPAAARIHPGVVVLLFTGWSRLRSTTAGYIRHSPYLTAAAAGWLASRHVKGVGIDHFTVGTIDSKKDLAAHLPLLEAGIWILEDIDIPEEVLCYDNMTLYAAPLKLFRGSGAPARPFIIVETADQ